MSCQKKIAVIGAGSSGLTAIKACKEENIDVVCFEKNGAPGGLWRYHDEDLNGVASVMKTTIINTSKEISAYSDFPPPKDFPNFMHHTKMYRYFMLYAEKFDLLKHIRYHIEVLKVEQAKNYDETGQWLITTKNSKTEEEKQEVFDGVLVCVGHHVFPKIPTFEGQEKFKGEILHTHSLKSCEGFSGKNVVVVGIGNSGVDAAVDSTFVAKQVYLSTRRGSWIFGRVGLKGRPYDFDMMTRKNLLLRSFRSFDSICDEVEKRVNEKFDHALYNLKPKHRVFSAHPTMNDAIPNCLISGRIKIKGDIIRFEENGVVFENDDEKLTEADIVIFATGYEIKFPFLPDYLVSTKENKVHLYKFCIPPGLDHKTLAIIANTQPIGPIFPIAEMQCRWFMQIFTGKLKLPPKSVMEKEIQLTNEANAKRYVNSTRHTIQIDFVPYLDDLAEQIGAKPNFLLMAVTDPELFMACMFGPPFNYHYRLVGPHKWEGAREAILNYEERAVAPFNTKFKNQPLACNKTFDSTILSSLSMLFAYIAILLVLVFKRVF